MSLVGTRPPTVDEWEQYELHHRSRMSTKPGMLCGVYVREYIAEYAEDMIDDQKVSCNIVLTNAVDCENLKADRTIRIALMRRENLSGRKNRLIFGNRIRASLLAGVRDAADLGKVYNAFVNCDYAFLNYTTHLFVTQFSSDIKSQYNSFTEQIINRHENMQFRRSRRFDSSFDKLFEI